MRHSVPECVEQHSDRLGIVGVLRKEPSGVLCYVLLAESTVPRFAEIETGNVFKRCATRRKRRKVGVRQPRPTTGRDSGQAYLNVFLKSAQSPSYKCAS